VGNPGQLPNGMVEVPGRKTVSGVPEGR
jgi:hypothetical protein